MLVADHCLGPLDSGIVATLTARPNSEMAPTRLRGWLRGSACDISAELYSGISAYTLHNGAVAPTTWLMATTAESRGLGVSDVDQWFLHQGGLQLTLFRNPSKQYTYAILNILTPTPLYFLN